MEMEDSSTPTNIISSDMQKIFCGVAMLVASASAIFLLWIPQKAQRTDIQVDAALKKDMLEFKVDDLKHELSLLKEENEDLKNQTAAAENFQIELHKDIVQSKLNALKKELKELL